MSKNGKRALRRITALLLSLTLIAPQLSGLVVRAEERTYTEKILYDLEETKNNILKDNNAETTTITFPCDAVVAPVDSEVVYHLFRQGNTEEEQTVTLMTNDITAGYKEDYEVVIDGKVVDGEAKRMLDGSDTVYEVYIGEDVLKEGDESSREKSDAKSEEAPEEEELTTQMKEQASSVFDVTFAPGEDVKEIRIRLYMPQKALGNREMQLGILECPQGVEAGENAITAITLEDQREPEPSEVAIVEGSAEQVDGYVTVLVERSGNTEGYTSYTLQSEDGTAVNGEDYILDKTQLMFTPGVAVQKIYIPLVSGEAGQDKDFTVKTESSEENVRYRSTAVGATFQKKRNLVDISMSDFSIGEYSKTGNTPAGEVDFYKVKDEDRYIFSFDTGIGDGDNRSASIRSDRSYDFTGIDAIRLSASYRVGTVAGDYLDVYASNTDYCTNKSSLASLATNHYGGRIGITPLTGQHVNDVPVDRLGEYYLYITAEQHNGLGYIGYNLYDQEFNDDDDDEGHVALVKHKYSLELVNPTQLNTGGTSKSPVTTQKLTLSGDDKVYGSNLDEVYRDDIFVYSYDLNISEAKLVGYDLVDKKGEKIYEFGTSSTTVNITSTILRYVESLGDDVIRIRPRFQLPKAKVTVKPQNFKELGADNLTAKLDEKNSVLEYYDNGVRVATFIWTSVNYNKGESLTFKMEENASYDGDYHFDSYKIVSGFAPDLTNVNPIYYTDKQWSITLNDDYYEITPILSNYRAPLYLEVKKATHGKFVGKPEDLAQDTYTVKEYDGKYETGDIAMFEAEPDEGYRAKWTCYDIVTNKTKTYYGSVFYYTVQSAIRSTDNIVTLEFEPCTSKKTFTMAAEVYMQGGSVLHQPDGFEATYAPVEGASVSVEGKGTLITDENGVTTKTVSIEGVAYETHTALVMANNRKYVDEYVIPASGTSIREIIKLSYYYNGPRVTSIRYYDSSYQVQNGDTIYLKDEGDICELSATIETNNKMVNCVEYSIISPDGQIRKEADKAEIKGTEYTWSVPLGLYAQEGDQIWIELLYQTVDEKGQLHRESYGKVNTGYNIVIADFETVSYIPDTGGIPGNITIWGNITFNFSVKGFKPIFTTSRSGNYLYITLGASFGFIPLPKGSGQKVKVPGWDGFIKQLNAFDKLRSGNEQSIKEGVQDLKKNMISFAVPVSLQLAYFIGEDPKTKMSEMYFLGAFFSVGFNASYTYSVPFVVEGIPMFATIVVTGAIADTIQIYAVSNTGVVELDAIKDPSKASYKPNNDFKANFDLTGTVGVGVNGIVGISGGAKAGLLFDWIDFQYGKGIASISAVVRLDLLLLGRTFNVAQANTVMFDTSPYKKSTNSTAEEPDMGLSDAIQKTTLDQWEFKKTKKYSQSISGTGEVLVSDAYEFTRPAIYPMGNNKYLIVCTVDGKYVNGYSEDGTAVLAYVIYDSSKGYLDPSTGQYTKNISGNAVFTAMEPAAHIGDSLNFNPKVVKAGDHGYMVVWNSVLYGANKEEGLNLSNICTVIKSAIINEPENCSGPTNYKSLAVTGNESGLNTNMIVDLEYDRTNDEILMMYRTSDLSGISSESTLEDYLNLDTALCVTSLKVSDTDPQSTWKDSIVIASGGKGNVLKSADMDMLKDSGHEIPVITWNKAVGEKASVFSESDEGIRNDILLASLSYSDGKYEKRNEVTVPSESGYQSSPVLAVNGSKNILMWKQEGRIAVADPIAVLNGFRDLTEDRGGANADEVAGLANITSVSAGNNDDFRLIEGKDGNLYAMWTEPSSEGDGHAVKVACLEEDAAAWGVGSTVLETKDNNYIQHISAFVDENSNLQMLYRQMDLKTDKSKICVESKNMAGKLTVSDIFVEKNGVKAGETVLVTAVVKNDGVKALPGRTIHLYENGNSTQIIKEFPALASGETTKVEFHYKVPKTINQREIALSANIDGNGQNTGRTVSEVEASLYATADLNFDTIKFVPLHVTNDKEPDKYKVYLQISNEGEADSAETEAVASYLEYKDGEDGTPTVDDHVLGHVTIPEIAAGDSVQASFDIEVPQEYYVNPECKYAETDFALYENYDTRDQRMVAMTYDGVKALTQERADEIKAEKDKYISVNQTAVMSVKCEPVTSQIHAGLTYKSSDPKIASVDANGIITAHKEGNCTITAATKGGLSTKTAVYVTKEGSESDSGQDSSIDTDETGKENNPGKDDKKENEKVNKKDKEKAASAVKTGDQNSVGMWIAIMFLAGMSLCYVQYRRRRWKR